MRHTRLLHLVAIAVILLGVFPAGTRAALHAAPAGLSFIVNSEADTSYVDSVITLREAIQVSEGANIGPFTEAEKAQLGGCNFDASNKIISGCGSGVADAITFAPGIAKITLASVLPDLMDTGTTISGYNTLPVIDAHNVPEGATFTINGDQITIHSITIINSQPAYADILVFGGSSAWIDENYLGIRKNDNCSDVSRTGAYGVVVTTQDGSIHADRPSAFITGNTIGCHQQDGILVYGSDYALIGLAYPFTFKPNFIGLDSDSKPIPNSQNGINISAFGTEIPQDTQIIYNHIGNNLMNGILLNDAQRTTVQFNRIGVTVLGIAAAPNQMDGIRIQGSQASENKIGEATSAIDNFISGNGQCGVNLISHAHHNSVMSNAIGLNLNQNGYIPNAWAAVALQYDAHDNQIGDWDSSSNKNNRISGNSREGIFIYSSSNNTIGFNNIIKDNGLAGVVVVDANSSGNLILPRQISGNGGIPIDLGNDGPTPNDDNDLDSGPNTLLNYPVIDSISGTVLGGRVCSGCTVAFYKATGDPARPLGGGELLGRVTAVGTDWTVDLASFPGGSGLTAADVSLVAYQWTSPSHNTSEMSPRPVIYLPLAFK